MRLSFSDRTPSLIPHLDRGDVRSPLLERTVAPTFGKNVGQLARVGNPTPTLVRRHAKMVFQIARADTLMPRFHSVVDLIRPRLSGQAEV